MRFGDLTYLEIKDKAAAGYLALVPTGCTEQQGPHLPVDNDSWFIETLTQTAAEQFGRALVLPTMPFGPTPEHRNYGSGFIDLPVHLHDAVYEHVLRSLAAQGFHKIVVWRGCGEHKLSDMVERFNAEGPQGAHAYLPDFQYYPAVCRVGEIDVPCGHAATYVTAIAMHRRPHTVRADRIEKSNSRPVRWDDPRPDFTKYSSNGVIGDPTYATPELGEALWNKAVEKVVTILRQIDER